MKKLSFLFFLLWLPVQAEGPVYRHPDASNQIEFENAYQDIRGKKNKIGVIDGSSANSGEIGEFVRNGVGSVSSVSSTGSNQYYDVTSISITAGDWDVTGIIVGQLNGATQTEHQGGIGTHSGNDGTGLTTGDNFNAGPPSTSVYDATIIIPPYRLSITTKTTVYLKSYDTFSAGTPKAYGRISARRVR